MCFSWQGIVNTSVVYPNYSLTWEAKPCGPDTTAFERENSQSLLINILFQGSIEDFTLLLPEDIIVHIPVMLAVNLLWQWRPAQVVQIHVTIYFRSWAENY